MENNERSRRIRWAGFWLFNTLLSLYILAVYAAGKYFVSSENPFVYGFGFIIIVILMLYFIGSTITLGVSISRIFWK